MSKKKILSLCLVIALAATAILGGTLAYFTDVDEVNNTFTMGKVDITLDEAKVGTDDKAPENAERVKENNYSSNMNPGHVFDKDPTIHVEAKSEDSYIFLDMTFNKYSSLFWVMAADADADETIAFDLLDGEGKLLEAFQNDNGVFSTTKFVKYMVANPAVAQAIIGKWFEGINHADWLLMDYKIGCDKDDMTETGNYMTLRFAYQGAQADEYIVASKDEGTVDITFMTAFKIPASLTQDMINAGTTVGVMQNAFNTDAEEFHMNFTAYAIQAAELEDVNAAYKAMFDAEPQFKG